MTRTILRSFLCALLAVCCVRASAAQGAASVPVASPRYSLSVPPGFELLRHAGVAVVCEPGDKAWVVAALDQLQPTTRPTTMPSDLVARLREQGAAVCARLGQDCALADTAPVAKRLSEQLLPELQKLEGFAPPLFYLVSSEARLKELLKSGAWASPGFYYNRVADQVMYRESVHLTVDRPMDDTLLVVACTDQDDENTRKARLHKAIQSSREEVQQMISGRAMFMTQMSFVELLMDHAFDPLKLPREQQWLSTGLAGVLSADYSAQIIGSSPEELFLLLAAELKNNPVKMRTIDLRNPAEPRALKKQFVAPYADAYRRKSMLVAHRLVQSNRAKLPALLSSLRAQPCPDNADLLLKRIEEIMGVNVTDMVAAP